MALTSTYTASLRTLSYTAEGTVESSEATQEYYTAGANRVGLLHFSGMNMTNKVITGIQITATASRAGYGLGRDKVVYLRKSNYQATSQSGVKGRAFVGDLLGTFVGQFYGNTSSYTLSGSLLTNLADYLSAGNNTLILYNPDPEQSSQVYSKNYLKWTAASITITYQEAVSQPTLENSTVTMGTAMKVTTNRQSTAATHTLRYSFFNASGTLGTNVEDSFSWTPPVSLAAQIPSATSGWGTLYCDTYIGETLIGTKQATFTLTVPASVVPTISAVTFAEATAGVAAKFGAFVRTRSTLSVSITAAGAQKSTISAYSALLNGATYSGASFTTGALNVAGSNTLTVTVTDSRGRTATTTKTVTVLAYDPPKLTGFSAERCNADGSVAQMDGTKVRISASATASAVGNKNSLTCTVYYRTRGAEAWATARTLTVANYAISATNALLTQTFDALSSYELKISVTDAFYTVEQTAEIGTKQVMIDLYKDGTGIAFGKVAETANTAEFGWPVKLSKPLDVAYGGTGANSASAACTKIGAVNKVGDTMTGPLKIEGPAEPGFYLIPTNTNRTYRASIQGTSTGVIKITAWENADGQNRRVLVISTAKKEASRDNALIVQCVESNVYTSYRVFHAGMATPVPIANGGTGASTAKAALTNLGVFYAETLPDTGEDGQICLVPV